jgi:hypothetical protein
MVNYGNGKIYRIVCNITGKQYIGATTIALCARLSQHKKLFNGKKNCLSREVIEGGDYAIYLIEDYPCERKEQLLARERHYIDNFDCVNKKLPLRTKQDWYNDNREEVIKKQIEWNINNVDKTRLYKKKYADKQKERRNAEINQLETNADLDVEFLNFVDIYKQNPDETNNDVEVYIGDSFDTNKPLEIFEVLPNTEITGLIDIPVRPSLITYSLSGNVKL